MSKSRKYTVIALVIIGISLIVYSLKMSMDQKVVEDVSKEVLKETVTIENPVKLNILDEHPDMSGYMYLEDPEPNFEEITIAETLRLFDEKGSAVIVLSSDRCPWCEVAIPVLNEVSKELGQVVYYVNAASPYNVSSTEEKAQMIDRLTKELDPVLEEEENGEKTLYIPLVVGIKDGVPVKGHVALVEGVESDEMGPKLTEAQKEELKEIYRDLFKAVSK